MKWWDSSALLSLLLEESGSERVESVLSADGRIAVWWGTRVECVSGISRVQRSGRAPATRSATLFPDLDELMSEAFEVPPSHDLRDIACRLLGRHDLAAADALQLAAALVWAEDRPAGLDFVCLDGRLREAASREGFRVLPDLE